MKIHESVLIAPGAQVRGDVTIGAESSVWYNAVLRGDEAPIVVGRRTNIQDCAVLHGNGDDHVVLGDDVSIGHGAIVHGCTVEDGAMIGMGAVVLNGARIGRGALVAAGALVPEGMEVPAGTLAVGCPAKVKGPLKESTRAYVAGNGEEYAKLAAQTKRELEKE